MEKNRNMKLRPLLSLCVCYCAMLSDVGHGAEPLDIGSRRELFVDDHLIDRLSGGARLQLHRPAETNDVFVHDTPWEGNRTLYYTIFQDGDIYRMYYRGSQIDLPKGGYSIPYNVTCYAESEDGIHWTRPNLGLVEFRGSKKNNIILSGEMCHAFTPFKDANPDCPDQHRYKAIVPIYKPVRGLHVYSSPDGIRWKPMTDKAVITRGYFDSQNLAFWDAARGCYVDFHRGLRGGPKSLAPPDHESSTKDVMTATSRDFLQWTEPEWLTYSAERWTRFSRKETPVSPFIQFYTNQVQQYHRAPHIYLGFPTRYVAGRGKLTELNERLAKHVEYFGNDYTDGGFMASRDGRHFKYWDEAFVRPGPQQKDRWVYGDNFQALGITETRSAIDGAPNELSVYVSENFWRQCRLRRYTLRLDGFVSVHASLSGGEILTTPFTMRGNTLALNMATSAAGSMQVEVQTVEGKPIVGFSLADCPEIFGDSVNCEVTWRDGTELSKLIGKPIRLRFVLKDADLYSFQFTSKAKP